MTDIVRKKIQRATIIVYATILMAVAQSIYLEIITSDYAHKTISFYFIVETAILGLMLVLGLKNKWTRIILVLLLIFEAVLFFQDKPMSPDELLMTLIFGLRVYIIAGLFNRTMNHYYKMNN